MKFEMMKVKTFRGREGHGFNGTLMADGTKVADVSDMANGGCYDWYWNQNTDAIQAEFKKQAIAAFHDKFEVEDSLASRLVDNFTMKASMKRAAKKHTIFVLPTHKEGQYVKTTTAIDIIAAKYPTAVIINRILDDADALRAALKYKD